MNFRFILLGFFLLAFADSFSALAQDTIAAKRLQRTTDPNVQTHRTASEQWMSIEFSNQRQLCRIEPIGKAPIDLLYPGNTIVENRGNSAVGSFLRNVTGDRLKSLFPGHARWAIVVNPMSMEMMGIAANDALSRATPESQGISSKDLLAYIKAASKTTDSMNSLMLLRHGKVVVEGWWGPYSSEDQHMLFSLSKSFTSTAVGLAIEEGKLDLDDPVIKFFPDEVPANPSQNLQSMRIRDLLTMSTGQRDEDISQFSFNAEGSLTHAFLAMEVPHKPGTKFLYNTAGTYMCSAIVQQVTGKTVLEYLRLKLFDPLGIKDPNWSASPQGISLGGYGLSIRTEDIAKLGQLYLQRGKWNEQQLVPQGWIELATSKQISNGTNPENDWNQGYGFQFWRCRYGNYRGDGAFGQYCIVMPEHDAVLAITSGTRDMGAVMSLAWTHLLPAMKDNPLPENSRAVRELTNVLTELQVKLPAGKNSSSIAHKISGKVFSFSESNTGIRSVALNFADPADAAATLVLDDVDGKHSFEIHSGSWTRTRTNEIALIDGRRVANPDDQGYAAVGVWTSDDTYEVKTVLFETPYYQTLTFKFSGDTVTINQQYNVKFGEGLVLTGTAKTQ